ncbi:hypothetical protein [Vibrio paucivorans]
MKKVLMVLLLVLGLAGAGAGYYLFVWKPENEVMAPEPMPEEEEEAPVMVEEEEAPKPEVTEYYVSPPKLGVREYPDYDAFVESVLYRGDKLTILEKKEGWGRISVYYVYEEGGDEVAEWVPMDALVEEKPVITKAERTKTLMGYVENSDDFKMFQDKFIETTGQLIDEGTCSPLDFEELGGWVRSVRYSERDVYFVYCGGMKQANKIYLDVHSGEIFYK